jgi:uncharacterized protein YjbJ (UPF0337 family)
MKHINRDAAKAMVEQAIDTLVPGAAEQLAGKVKATIGQGQGRLGEHTSHPELVVAGHMLEVEGKVEEIVGRVKAASANAAGHVKTAAADVAGHVEATGERLSAKIKGSPRNPSA